MNIYLKTKYIDSNVDIIKKTYVNDNICLVAESNGERIATLTANTDLILDKNHCCIKDYSENEGVLDALINLNLVKNTGRIIHSGYVDLPIVEILF